MQAIAINPALRGPRIRTSRPRRKPSGLPEDIFVFVIGVCCSVRLHLIGDLPLGEVILVAALPFLCVKYWRRIANPANRTIYWLMAVWLLSQIVSDVVNGSPFDSRLKGMARVIFFAFDFMGFSALIGKNTRRIVWLTMGLAIAELIWGETYGLGGLGMSGTGWKFGGSMGVTMLVLLVASYFCSRGRYGIYVLLATCLAAANLHFGYRSQIAVDLVSVVFTLPIFLGSSRAGVPPKNSASRVILLLVCSLGALWVSESLVHEAVKRGYFQEATEQKFEQQSSGKLGVLLGGRPEIPVALTAIADKPIFGHGSYAIEPKYMVMLQDYQYRYGYTESDDPPDVENAGIPTHSHLFAMWVEAGFFASFLWFYLLVLIVRGTTVLAVLRPPLAPLYALFWVQFFWDILFSPFGFDRRIYEGFCIVLLINVTSSRPARVAAMKMGEVRRRIYRGTPNRPVLSGKPRIQTVGP